MVEPSLSADLSMDEVRMALEEHIRTTRWGWRDLSQRLDIVSLERTGAFDVIFQSFTETRTVEATFEPYRGAFVDGPNRGRSPLPWEIQVQMPEMFTRRDGRILRIPHTDEVRVCHVCNGSARIMCSNCGGDGQVSCGSCGGDGRTTEWRTITETDSQGNTTTRSESYSATCSRCHGSGKLTCSTCSGSGYVTCPTCQGLRQLCHFRQLLVVFATRTDSKQIEETALPDDLIAGANGIAIFQEEDAQLEAGNTGEGGGGPYRGADVRVNSKVAQAANWLLGKYQLEANQRLHRQRIVVRAVPVFEARYRWRKEERKFWVYGTDKQVYAPNYPRSPWRIGGAILGGATVPASIVALLTLSDAPEPVRHSPEIDWVVAVPAALPEPAPPPAPSLPFELEHAPGPKPEPGPGKGIVELRTDPAGFEVFEGKRKIGVTPMWVTILSPALRPCLPGGHCTFGRCANDKCEPTKELRLRNSSSEQTIEIGPSDGDLVEIR